MNLSVQKPTKIIRMHINGPDTNKSVEGRDKREMGHLDFYTITNDIEENTILKGDVLSSQIISELASLTETLISNKNTPPRKSLISKDSTNFVLMSLKNDIRVQQFKPDKASIEVYFWIIDDAISFYQQYFDLVEMHFVETTDFSFKWKDVDFNDVIPSSVSTKFALPTTQPCQSNKDASAVKDIKMPDELSGIRPFIIKQDPGIHPSVPLCVKSYDAQKKEFDGRVDYFNKMKTIFSKNEFKKMEASIEAGDFGFIFKDCKELSVGSSSNVIIQKAIKKMDDDAICKLIEGIGYDIAPVSATKYGAYTIQTLITAATTKASQDLISCYLKKNGRFLISHEIGNYTIQKILRFDEKVIYDLFIEDMEKIFMNPLGFKVFRRCLPFFTDKKDVILEKLKSIETPENSEQCITIRLFI